MFELVGDIHGFLRWLALILGVGGFIHAGGVWSQGTDPGRLDQFFVRSFVGLLDLQLLLGLVLLLSPDSRAGRLPHALIMLVAIALAHWLSLRVRRVSPDGARRALLALFSLPLVLVLIGTTVFL